ncbi:MAG: exodeoxyribonuclease VII small subunit [Coxiellaceae bacterium]|nr:exodeoxyribonuclease VII small subunit [Coxiellaceae bacterium]
MTKEKTIDFEKSLDKLNTLVEKMEQGNLPLETSLKHFEEGIKLIRQCQEALNKAEQTVKILTKKHGKDGLDNFDTDE